MALEIKMHQNIPTSQDICFFGFTSFFPGDGEFRLLGAFTFAVTVDICELLTLYNFIINRKTR